MSSNKVNCQNCEEPYEEGFQFCPHCGQKTNDQLTIGVLFYNTISNYFSFDARFLKSFIPLMFRPGYLAKEFIKGKRLLYLHPAQMYLFISVVFFFIFSFTVRDQSKKINDELSKSFDNEKTTMIDSLEMKKLDSLERIEIREALEKSKIFTGMTEKEIDSIASLENLPKKNDISLGKTQIEIDSLLKRGASDEEIYNVMGLDEDDGWFKTKVYQQALKLYKNKDAGSIWSTFFDTVPIALFFLLPIFAFIIKVFYLKKGRYAHHLVFGFYYFSFVFTVFSIIFGLNRFWDIPDWVDFLIALSTFIYLYFALKNYYGQGWFLTLVKTCVTTFVFMLIVIPCAIAIIGLYSFLYY